MNSRQSKIESWMVDLVSDKDWKNEWCTSEIWDCKREEVADDCCISSSEPIDCSNMQKKIMPWTSMFFENECLNINEDDECLKSSHENLIVVASLIDKIPNLGGLCRSCEIFGVGTYVIGSKKYCDNKEFQTLSVTSDRYV